MQLTNIHVSMSDVLDRMIKNAANTEVDNLKHIKQSFNATGNKVTAVEAVRVSGASRAFKSAIEKVQDEKLTIYHWAQLLAKDYDEYVDNVDYLLGIADLLY